MGNRTSQRALSGAERNLRKVDVDRYGKVVARCRVDGIDVGQELVSEGLAFAYRKYSMVYDLDEKLQQ
jgi:endonuclease YncB( thermonuclease family)